MAGHGWSSSVVNPLALLTIMDDPPRPGSLNVEPVLSLAEYILTTICILPYPIMINDALLNLFSVILAISRKEVQ